jgi:hypothetical protein
MKLRVSFLYCLKTAKRSCNVKKNHYRIPTYQHINISKTDFQNIKNIHICKLSILTFPFENRPFLGCSFIRSRQIKTNI